MIEAEHAESLERWRAERQAMQERHEAEFRSIAARREAARTIVYTADLASRNLGFVGSDEWRRARERDERERRILAGEDVRIGTLSLA